MFKKTVKRSVLLFDAYFTKQYFDENVIEKGYLFINAVLHTVIKNKYVGIAVIRTITLSAFWGGIYVLRNKINVGWAVMAYMALFYYQSINLLRLTLAGGICFISFVLLFKKKYTWGILFAAIAITIHKSSVLFLITVIIYFLYISTKHLKSIMRILILISIPILILFGKNLILSFVLMDNFMKNRYGDYLNDDSTIGFMQLIFWAPVIIILYAVFRNGIIKDRTIVELCFIFSCAGFVLALWGYDIGILTRASIYFGAPFIVLIPYYMKFKKDTSSQLKINFESYNMIAILMFLYWIIRLILNLYSYFLSSGLNEYNFFWNQ